MYFKFPIVRSGLGPLLHKTLLLDNPGDQLYSMFWEIYKHRVHSQTIRIDTECVKIGI